MKTLNFTQADMAPYIARFADLKPNKADYSEREGVPVEAYEMVAAKFIYFLLGAPKEAVGANTQPAVPGLPGTSLYIVECPPGDGPSLHAHMKTRETFFCLRGKFDVLWGDEGENAITLEPFDMISVPAGVTRAFKNVDTGSSFLLAMIQGEDDGAALNDIALTPAVGEEVVRRFGPAAKQGLERVGMVFTAGVED